MGPNRNIADRAFLLALLVAVVQRGSFVRPPSRWLRPLLADMTIQYPAPAALEHRPEDPSAALRPPGMLPFRPLVDALSG